MNMRIKVTKNDYVRSVTIFSTDLEGRDDLRCTSLIGDVNDSDLTIYEHISDDIVTPFDIGYINSMFSDLEKEPTMIKRMIRINKPFGYVEISIKKADD